MVEVSSAPHETMVSAILAYLSLLKHQPDDAGVRLERLAEALDRLVIEYHHSVEVELDQAEVDAPCVDYVALAARAAASFPELGKYGDVDPKEGFDRQFSLGDAIDDLADIARDLTEVMWLFDHVGPNDAVWMFRFGYRTHWGRHLHDLRRYLHAIMYS